MTTLVIDRETLPETVSSLFGAGRSIRVAKEGPAVVLLPEIDPDDYDNDTDYLNAIPGFVESVLKSFNSPRSEDVPVEEIWPDV